MDIVSGAGHDAQIMASVCPACMIFVPSEKGISHNITEYTKPGMRLVVVRDDQNHAQMLRCPTNP